MLYTTLKLLRQANACTSGMETLTGSLGSDWKENQEIPLVHILESNGLDHAIWAMRATTVNCKKEIVLLACDFAEMCLNNFEKIYPDDLRPRLAIQAAKDYIDGKITKEAADSAALAAALAAYSAYSARSARSAAASAAALAAASARSAAALARSAAAYSARSAAAYSAAQEKQKQIFLLRIS